MASQGIADYYAGKSVFITGATGFLGKVLVEKLLRCCPKINKIYLLMRPKKGQNVKERLVNFLNFKVFERIQRETPKSFEKLFVIPGDILEEGLGITQNNKDLIQKECHIVFNGAACVRFNMPLREATNTNIKGTQDLLELAQGMSKLEVFLHISTAYCRCDVDILEERVYPAKIRPQDLLNFIRWVDDETLNSITERLIYPEPNTYSYTKFLAENLVSEYAGKFPIAIARPSIVAASYKEPMPGWVDNLNNVTGLIVGAGKGVICTVLCNGSARADIVPVDFVVNGCIIMAQKTALEKSHEVQVCNITNSETNPVTWEDAVKYGEINVIKHPFTQVLWYPGGCPERSKLLHELKVIFFHLLPAYLIDFLLFMFGQKTFMVRVQKRISDGFKVVAYYLSKDWYFCNDNFLAFQKILSLEDNKTFFTDLSVIDQMSYAEDYVKGARQYVCKEDPATLPAARRKMRILYYVHITSTVLRTIFIMYLIYRFIDFIINRVY